jgi:hypothetical protein
MTTLQKLIIFVITVVIVFLFVQSVESNTNANVIVIAKTNFYGPCRWNDSVTNKYPSITLSPGRCEKDMGVIRSFDR